MVAGVISAGIQAAYGAVLGYLAGGWVGLAIGGALGLLFGCFFGWALTAGSVYPATAGGVFTFVVDSAGAICLVAHFLSGHTLDRVTSSTSARINVVEGMSPKYATTIGTVVAGGNARIQRHEDVHILQARILGPLYLPLVGLNYALWVIAPIWMLWHDHGTRPINSFGRYFEVGVYPHVWNEAIAYRIQGTPPS
jgi:hypothetical protein